ncbi:MAG: hypothetical protein ACI4L8_04345 [Candidatus Fimadaptatus sp.]
MEKAPNAFEVIERLSRESERQRIEIEALQKRIAELEALLASNPGE